MKVINSREKNYDEDRLSKKSKDIVKSNEI